MGPMDVEKSFSTGKKRQDREEQSKDKFDPLHLEVKYPGTAILLLQCREKPILLAAAAALAKFGTKSQRNLEALFDLEIVGNVIALIEHEDLFTRRFAAKLLAEMTSISCVRNYLLESDYYISHFAKVLATEKDTFMQEFSSLILSEISKDMYGVAQLLKQCSDMNFLFERIRSQDPDVTMNNMQILYNLMQDPIGAKWIVEAKDFNLSLIYELFRSPYPEIQRIALSVTEDFAGRSMDEELQYHFRQTKGLQALLGLLDNDEWHDLHGGALKILSLACENLTTVESLDDIGGVGQILKYLEGTSNSKLFLDALKVVVRLSGTSTGRKALHCYGIVDLLMNSLKSAVQPDAYEIGCHGIGMMTLYSPAAKELTTKNCLESILGLIKLFFVHKTHGILKNESLKWSIRQAALFALNELLKYDVENCNNLLNVQGQNYLVWLVKQTMGKIPVEVQTAAVEVLATIARHSTLRNFITSVDTIDALCAPFQSSCPSSIEFKIACCNALSVLCIEKTGRDAFLRAQGPSRLYNLLCDVECIPLRNAAAQLVQFLSADPALASAFVASKYLSYMLNNRSSARILPSWDTCIEALFDAHLPIKFAFTGRLSLHDITHDGFYVLRRNVCPFPVLDDMFRFKFCPLEPVYVVNCAVPRRPNPIENTLSKTALQTDEAVKASNGKDGRTKGIFLSSENVSGWLDLKFGRLQCDPSLYECIELFKCKLVAAESTSAGIEEESGSVNVQYVARRARMLAKFVARQMSGPDPTSSCIDHQLEVHVKEIKDRTETSVVPLGLLRVGSYLERALLFKVIADRICLPAALVRGEYGKAWIEIAVPQIEHPEEETSFHSYLDKDSPCPELVRRNNSRWYKSTFSFNANGNIVSSGDNKNGRMDPNYGRRTIFPRKLMKPNFIVDLMITPGDLIPIGSSRSQSYCERRLICEMVCCD